MTKTNRPKKFSLVLSKENEKNEVVTIRMRTKSQAKFTRKLNQITDLKSAFLKITYEDGGVNSGNYPDKEKLLQAYQCFIEK